MQSEIKITIPSKNWGANVLAGNKKQLWIKSHAWNEQEVTKLVTFVEANGIKGCELLEMSSGDIEKDLECTKGIAEELHRLINIYNKNVENWTPLELSSVVESLNIVADADLRKSAATYIDRNGVIASEFKKWSGDDFKKKMGIEKGVLWLVRLSKYIDALSTNKTSTNDKEKDTGSENESEREKQREKDRKKEEEKKRSQRKIRTLAAKVPRSVFDDAKETLSSFFPIIRTPKGEGVLLRSSVTPDTTVKELRLLISEQLIQDGKKLQLLFNSQILVDDKTLAFYHIVNSQCIISTASKVAGGSKMAEGRVLNLKNPLIHVTDKPDCITYDSDADYPRAVNPNKEDDLFLLYSIKIALFEKNEKLADIYCPLPECNQVWDWTLVATVANLTAKKTYGIR
ncbi:hypothetical protein RFI_13116 [Reticulomyxa filosa]|uniref:Ubiquitin-like domain-containing protein n=1 Tax=Reticulomyxa filosa TaxID=46433 RepID=X6NCK8_RETFI|nr:hypothetical protein RFI_13116 [Reticulomyxa filosa]|eukprot:ETO24045.1 hypothetical protein RFI_13116 [Reticulomyxa filosa]